MILRRLVKTANVLILFICISCACASIQNSESQKEKDDQINSVLDKLNKRTQELNSFQCQIEYKFVQPSVFGVETLRKGVLYYSNLSRASRSNLPRQGASTAGENKDNAKMRVNFQTLEQDQEKEQKYQEQYIAVDGSALPVVRPRGSRLVKGSDFEGFWLVHLDYDVKSAKFIQIAHSPEPNKSVDVFELVSEYLPMVGFTKSQQLKGQFDISLVEPKSGDSSGIIQVHLKVKPNSVYKDDYVQIDCWIDKQLNLPVKIVAISNEPADEPLDQKDYSELKFLNAKVNEKIDSKVFDFQIPKDFDEPEIYPLNDK